MGLARVSRIHSGEKPIALVLLPAGLSELVFAYGAWALRPWAWTLGVALEIVVIVLALLQLGRLAPVRHIITIVIAGVVLSYLATPRVRVAFGRS